MEVRKASKAIHQDLLEFFEQPTRPNFQMLLSTHFGESAHLDFKAEWPERTKLAKHVLAMANSNGGCLVVGVEEMDGTLNAVGLKNKPDKSEITRQLRTYIPANLDFDLIDIFVPADGVEGNAMRMFQSLLVQPRPEDLPYMPLRAGEELRDTAIYVRFGSESREARSEEIRSLIRRASAAFGGFSYQQLKIELGQLAALQSELNEAEFFDHYSDDDKPWERDSKMLTFLRNCVLRKRALIESKLGLDPIDHDDGEVW